MLRSTIGNLDGDLSPRKSRTAVRSLDPKPNKALADSIGTVSRRVRVVYSSFAEVKRIISNPSYPRSTKLEEEWDELEKDFTFIVQTSSKVAANAATFIRDFIYALVPHLLEEPDISKRQTELDCSYEMVCYGSGLASDLAGNLRTISDRVLAFGNFWKDQTLTAVDKLREEIGELEESIITAKRLLVELKIERGRNDLSAIEAAGNEVNRHNSRKGIKDDEASIKILERTSKREILTGNKAQKHTKGIASQTDEMAKLWTLIQNDVESVRSDLQRIKDSNGSAVQEQIFCSRLLNVQIQYRELHKCLQMYSSAIDPAGSTSFFTSVRRLLRI